MPKPIFDLDFWRTRLRDAKAHNRLHFSVYVHADMAGIDAKHREIVHRLTKGKILDAGCGYGRTCSWFSPRNYIGIDFSPDFIAEANFQFPGYDFRVCDLMKSLPFKDDEFDWAIMTSMKQMIVANLGEETWMTMLTNLKKVAKNVLILEYVDPEVFEIL